MLWKSNYWNKNCTKHFNKRKAIQNAFNYWAQVADLAFFEVCKTCKSDITIDFNHGDHLDGYPVG